MTPAPERCPGCGRPLVIEPDGERWCPSCTPVCCEPHVPLTDADYEELEESDAE